VTCGEFGSPAWSKESPKTRRYRVTPFGLRAALFFARMHARLYDPLAATFTGQRPPQDSDLASQFHKLENHIQRYIEEAKLVA
jgi:hypothetical protein